MKFFLCSVFMLFICCYKDSDFIITKQKIEEEKKLSPFLVTDFEKNVFRGWTYKEIRNVLNPLSLEHNISEINNFDFSTKLEYPDSFDFRNTYPNCILPIKNQGQCDASWAMSLTGTLSNRFCINGQSHSFSAQDLISCDTKGFGCSGGLLPEAFQYIIKTGVVTDDCWPFESSQGTVTPCRTTCKNPSVNWQKFYCKTNSVIGLYNEKEQKTEITKGPVISGFYVYEDFLSYQGGIYHHKSGGLIGGLVVKVIGYGINPEKYWIAENVFGSNWGEGGYFRIGAGECNFDDTMMICSPMI